MPITSTGQAVRRRNDSSSNRSSHLGGAVISMGIVLFLCFRSLPAIDGAPQPKKFADEKQADEDIRAMEKPFSFKNDVKSVASAPVDQDFAKKLTFIMPAMARICNPSTGLFRKVWETHEEFFEGFTATRRLVVFDGFGDVRLDEQKTNVTDLLDLDRYLQYKQNIREFVAQKQREDTGKIEILELQEHGGLLGGIDAALKVVKTKIIYVTQDDLALRVPIPTKGIVETMSDCLKGRNPVRFVLLNKRFNWKVPDLDDFYGVHEAGNSTNFTNAAVLEGMPSSLKFDPSTVKIPLLRTKRWSDNNHFAFKEDYVDFLIPQATRKWIDSKHQEWLKAHPETWFQYGTHILGDVPDKAAIIHYDARDRKYCNESLIGK